MSRKVSKYLNFPDLKFGSNPKKPDSNWKGIMAHATIK
jgi:hypothetical protein